MKLLVRPAPPLHGSLELPGDKSLSHRTALLASMAQGSSQIENFQVSGVTRVMLTALEQLGIQSDQEDSTLTIHGKGISGWQDPVNSLDCGNSATTMRLLAGALPLCGVKATLDGSNRLRQRPMERIIAPLTSMGVPLQSNDGFAPLAFSRPDYPLSPIQCTLPVASAQVKTCLLLASLVAGGPSTLIEPGPSRDHTERLLRHQGFDITTETLGENSHRQYKTCITPPRPLIFTPINMRLPGDISSAAFLMVAALIIPGSEITIRNVGLNPTRTGLLDALLAMEADIHILSPHTSHGEPVGDLLIRHSRLKATCIHGDQVVRMIDEFPVFAIAAAYAQGKSCVRNGEELRYKESDRIASVCKELNALGIQIVEKPDGFEITGSSKPLNGVCVHSHGDHRLAMALVTAGLASQETQVVENAEVIDESFPEFLAILNRLGAHIISGETL